MPKKEKPSPKKRKRGLREESQRGDHRSRSSVAPRPGRNRGSRGRFNTRRILQPGSGTRGGNSLYLMSRQISEGRGDNRWGTYNQIREAGGQVRKGERGTRVLFFKERTPQGGEG